MLTLRTYKTYKTCGKNKCLQPHFLLFPKTSFTFTWLTTQFLNYATGGTEAKPECCTGGTEATPECCTSGTKATPECCTGGTEATPECCTGGTEATPECCTGGTEAIPEY